MYEVLKHLTDLACSGSLHDHVQPRLAESSFATALEQSQFRVVVSRELASLCRRLMNPPFGASQHRKQRSRKLAAPPRLVVGTWINGAIFTASEEHATAVVRRRKPAPDRQAD